MNQKEKNEEEFTIKINPTQLRSVGIVILVGVVFLGFYLYQQSQATINSQQQAINAQQQELSSTTQKLQQIENQTNKLTAQGAASAKGSTGNLSPAFIKAIEPSVVEINCYSGDKSIESSGSGVSYIPNNLQTHVVMTNYHVYAGAVISGVAPTCYAVFPEPPNFYYNEDYGDYQLTLSSWHYNPNTYEDAAVFTLGTPISSTVPNPIPSIKTAYDYSVRSDWQCPDGEANTGDSVTIFGYPNSGNLLGISETVTEGIISGILPGPIYKTNAGIDHGNSGGIAILNKSGCSLGIPTLGQSGLTSGIGYVQSYSLVKTPITNQ